MRRAPNPVNARRKPFVAARHYGHKRSCRAEKQSTFHRCRPPHRIGGWRLADLPDLIRRISAMSRRSPFWLPSCVSGGRQKGFVSPPPIKRPPASAAICKGGNCGHADHKHDPHAAHRKRRRRRVAGRIARQPAAAAGPCAARRRPRLRDRFRTADSRSSFRTRHSAGPRRPSSASPPSCCSRNPPTRRPAGNSIPPWKSVIAAPG